MCVHIAISDEIEISDACRHKVLDKKVKDMQYLHSVLY